MAHEVTNAEFRPFVQERLRPVAERVLAPEAFARLYAPHTRTDTAWLAHWWQLIPFAAQAGYCMDSTATAAEFQWAYMDPLLRYYLFHPAYDNYPALGVSWQAANDYAQWLTLRVNAERAAKRLPPVPALRLPTEAEWEYAARGGVTGNVFPWPGPLTVSFGGRGKTRAGYLANYKPLPGNYHEDGFLFTAPVGNFPPNYLGLYDMAGNAAEWTHDRWLYQPSRTDSLTHWLATADTSETPLTSPLLSVLPPHEALRDSLRVVRGGSWACPQACLLCGSRTYWPQHQQSWRIGFRLAYSLVQERY
jgi:formylglycine-generating enzyme required for sulfatase activity